MTMTDPLRPLRPVPEEAIDAVSERDPIPSGKPLAYDVYLSNHELVIEFDVPGIDAGDLTVELQDRKLVVTASRELHDGGGMDVIETGRQHGTFTRRLFLSDRWDVDRLTATIERGVLHVRAPMTKESTRRRIDIELPSSVPPASIVEADVPATTSVTIHSAA